MYIYYMYPYLSISPSHQICTFLKQGATQAWDGPQQVPYAYNQGTWVGYDNVKSFQIKVCCFIYFFNLNSCHKPKGFFLNTG